MNCTVTLSPSDAPCVTGLRFREILGSVASGVAVVTTNHQNAPHGMTATAFSSVCADPPTVLIVLNRSTRSYPLVSASGRFVVNFLAEHQAELSQRFAGKLDDQFAGVACRLNAHGAPVIEGAAAVLECMTIEERHVGTHAIFIARVVDGAVGGKSPLLYHSGAYKAVKPLEEKDP